MVGCLQTEIGRLRYGESPAELYEPLRYLMSLGGKRLRPLLTLLGAALYGDDWQRHVSPALAIETFHNFTLMHDDLMDAAPLRRGQPTVHEKWNASTAILAGDVMLVQAYELLLSVNPTLLPEVLRAFNRCAAEVCEGQQLDMNFESRLEVSEEEYLEMIRLKTAVLVGFALELGGRLAGAPTEDLPKLRAMGQHVGVGFQLHDDLLDVFGDQAKFGKRVGGDIVADKKTFLLIKALELAQGEERQTLVGWLGCKTDDSTKVQAVTTIYERLGIRSLTEARRDGYFERGQECLAELHVPAERKAALADFIQQLIGRES